MARRDAEHEAIVMDDDDDDGWIEEQMDDDEEPVLMVRRPGANPNRLPLHHFLRLIAGGRIMEHGAAATNEALVQSLRRNGVIQSDPVKRAMQLCPRDLFVPAEHADEALVDAPIRVERHGFNISAPHMHATCLEALQLRPGHRFLDVGSGCGLMTACGAYLVGPSGCAVGFDVRREALAMSRDAARRLTAGCPEYASASCPMRFELQNVFMPASRWLGQFDRVHVGAACPPDRLAPLLALLRPEGGLVVVPVTPSDLRVISRGPGGAVSQRVVSQVRFSELEVPSDAEVLLAALRGERRARTAPARQPSTYARDVAAIVAAVTPTPTPQGSYGDACAAFMPSSSPSAVIDGLPPTPHAPGGDKARPRGALSRLFSACSSGSAADEAGMEGAASSSSGAGSEAGSPPPPQLCLEELGEPDCVLMGPGWELPAHRAVLRQRCDHFRARCDAGWADSAAQVVRVPDHFGRAAVAAFLHYCLHDCLEECSDPQEAVAVLHVALYYSCPRLASLCEHRLAQLLRGRPRRGAARQRRGGPAQAEQEEGDEGLPDAAAALLALADEAGLPHLRAVALDYVVHNFGAVAATESYAALSREQVSMVAEEACAAHSRLVQQIRRMADQQPLPDPSY